nr:MAG TPA: hypothetical protein [Caudoviricetes sp.]
MWWETDMESSGDHVDDISSSRGVAAARSPPLLLSR